MSVSHIIPFFPVFEFTCAFFADGFTLSDAPSLAAFLARELADELRRLLIPPIAAGAPDRMFCGDGEFHGGSKES